MKIVDRILTQIPGNPLDGLHRADRAWEQFRSGSFPVTTVIRDSKETIGETDFDVVICGGTLGIFIGAALAKRGWKVAVVERGTLRGRDQEWNISRQELQVFLELELLSETELETAIATEYNPARVNFLGGTEIWVRDILNIGVDPVFLLETLKQKFLAAGGILLENTAFESAIVATDGVRVQTRDRELKTRLLIDAMGHFSPIVRQFRQREKADGICMVVGTCAKGYDRNETGDLFVSFTPIQNKCQYFWEAFPARDGRTTYLFTYLDVNPDRFGLEFLLSEYFRLLPEYQNIDLDRLDWVRSLFGFFPSYRRSPLQSPCDRLVFVGDSSSNQSPLSFGGFGAMVRHLDRLTNGIDSALKNDIYDRDALALLQPYQPNLSVAWLFQETMRVKMSEHPDPNAINDLLSAVFAAMESSGDAVLRPFLQDVIRFDTLSQALFQTAIASPGEVVKVLPRTGIVPLLKWMPHYTNLGLYRLLYSLGRSLKNVPENLPPQWQFRRDRLLEAWKYGAGLD